MSILSLFAQPVLAEVVDKMVSVYDIWQWSLVGAVVGFIVCRFHPLLGIITLTFAAYFTIGLVSELMDPSVGASILREAGPSYALNIGAAWCIIALSHVLGTLLFLRRLRHRRLESRDEAVPQNAAP